MIRKLFFLLAFLNLYAEDQQLLIPELEEIYSAEGLSPQMHEGKISNPELVFAKNSEVELADSGKLLSDSLPRESVPFGDFRSDFGEVAGYKLLWSHLFLLSQTKIFNNELVLQNADSEISISHQRIYPFLLDAQKTQIFRERLIVDVGDKKPTFNYLSFRLAQDEDEPFWTKSPGMERATRLAGSLRNDSLPSLQFSLNDLQIFSGRPDAYSAKLIGVFEFLVPFKTLKPLVSTPQNSCALVLQHQAASLDGVLAGLKFIKRRLLKLELIPKDPYSMQGSEVLYFDYNTLMPVAKLVYSRDSEKYKFVMGVMQPVIIKAGILPSEIFIFDLISKQRRVLKTKKFETCDNYTATINYPDFDPSMIK